MQRSRASHMLGLGSSLFDRLYWGSRCLFPFLQVLRWVSSLRSLPCTMDSCTAHTDLPCVVSESRIPPDLRPLASTRGFSQLSHVLRRLLVPRHPSLKGGDPAAGSPTATLLRLSPNHRARLRRRPPFGWTSDFGRSQLSWLDGRCVQGSGTYSPRRS
jgi:hypothetical protein